MLVTTDLSRALNKVAREKMILVNQGFVHAVILRYRERWDIAQVEYADNLAETRRLLTLLLHMSRMNVEFDPDGAGGSESYARPRLGSNLKQILESDLAVSERCFPAFDDVRHIVSQQPELAGSRTAIETIHTETLEYLRELRIRSSGKPTSVDPADARLRSEAETITLEHFIGYSKEIDPRWRSNSAPAETGKFTALIAGLNALLMNEFLAIEQLLIHGFLLNQWGMHASAERSFWQSVEEMRAAFRLSQVVLVLGGDPGSAPAPDCLLPHRVRVGKTQEHLFGEDLTLLQRLIAIGNAVAVLAETDDGASEAVGSIQKRHTAYQEWLVERLQFLTDEEKSAAYEKDKSSSFDAMLARWNVH